MSSQIVDLHKKRELMKLQFHIADKCFDICVNNFRTREVDPGESMCVVNCAQKYLNYQNKASFAFQEQSLIIAQQSIQAALGTASK